MADKFDDLGFQEDSFVEDQQKPSISSLESGLRGLAQGASLGLADELTGAAEAGLEAAKKVDVSSLLKDYERYRDETRKLYKQAQEADPSLYGVGEVAGALGSGLAMPVGRGASLAAKVAEGAGLGGLAGFGASEAEGQQLAEDVAKGAALGGGLTGAVSGIASATKKGLSSLSDLAEKTDITKKLKLAAKMGQEGVELSSKQPALEAAEAIESIPKFIKEETLPIRASKMERLSELTKSGESYDISAALKKGISSVDEAFRTGSIDEATAQRLKQTLQEEASKPSVSPLEYQDLIDKMYNLQQRAVGEGKKLFKGVGGSLREGIKDEEIKKANKLIHEALSSSEEAIDISKGAPSADTVNILKELVEAHGNITRAPKLKNLTQSMENLNAPKAKQLLEGVKDKLLRQEVSEEASQRGIGNIQQALGSARAVSLNAANLAGKSSQWFADKATRYQGTKLGATLNSLATTQGPRRAALIYSAMQLPEDRQELEKLLTEE